MASRQSSDSSQLNSSMSAVTLSFHLDIARSSSSLVSVQACSNGLPGCIDVWKPRPVNRDETTRDGVIPDVILLYGTRDEMIPVEVIPNGIIPHDAVPYATLIAMLHSRTMVESETQRGGGLIKEVRQICQWVG